MPSDQSKVFLQALGMGAMAGIRTFSAPVTCAHILSHRYSGELGASRLRFMQSGVAANVFKILAIGELIADKLPFTANRIRPLSLTARCLSGALVGAAIYKSVSGNLVVGAAAGTGAALISSFVSFYLRKAIVDKSQLPDPVVAIMEDLFVIAGGLSLNCIGNAT